MQDAGVGAEYARPATLPGPDANVEILHISWFVRFIETAERREFRCVVQRAAAASVEHVRQIFAVERITATDRKLRKRSPRWHHSDACLLAAPAFRKKDLRGRAEQPRNAIERLAKRGEKTGLNQHVVVQQTDMGVARTADSAIYRAGT